MVEGVGIGIFGYGFIAGAHVEALRAVGAGVVAVCGPRREAAEAFARRYGIEGVYTDPQHLLDRADVRAVVVCTPDADHAPLTIAAARAGKHVFCEKPLAMNLAEARQMVAAVSEAGVVGMTGFLLRGAPVVRRIAHTLQSGEAGQLISLHTQRYNASLLGPGAMATWRTDPTRSGLGVLGDLGAHMVDLALLFGGPVRQVSADLLTFVHGLPDATTGRPVALSLDDDVALALRFASGAHGTISLSRVGLADSHLPLGRSEIVLNASNLAIVSDGMEHAAVHRLGSAPQEWPVDETVASLDHGQLLTYLGQELMRGFLAAIAAGRPASPTLEDGLAVQAVLEAAARSATSRRWEDVPV